MNLRAKIAVAAGVLLLAGCRELPRYFAGDTTIARAGGKDLRLGDVRSVVPQGLSGDDSAAFMKVYIDRWVLKQLKLQEAETLFSSSAGDIDKMVEEYRQALLIRQLDQHYVDRSIDTVFTADEIAAYYNAHKADFKLDRTIVKGRIVRFGEGYRQAAKLKTLMGARSEAQQQDFRDICEKNDFTVDDFRDQWIDFPEFLSYLPTLRSQSYDSVLATAAVQEMRDSHAHYYSQIDSVKVNDTDIMARVEEQVQQMVEAEGSIPQLEAKHHMPIFNIREIMRQRYEEQAYANSMQTEVVDKVSVIPGEVERFYKSISKDSLPLVADQYVYAQITKFPKSMTAAKQRTRERLIDMRERVITGKAKFENLARMYSQDPGTMMRGGEMDPSTLEQLDPAFGAALEKMRPGQISEVVESQFGFHIIQLLDKRGRLYHFRHILLRPVYTTEELGGSLNTLDSLVKVIRKDSITFERAALLYSDDAQSKMNGGIVSNHDILERFNAFDAKLTVTKFLKEDFGRFKSLDDYNALNRLKPGEISEAYLTEDMLGNQMAKIVKLVEVIPTHTASLNEDYLRLEEMALQDKQERVFKEWLSKKIDGMYVYISPEFRNGEFENKHWVK